MMEEANRLQRHFFQRLVNLDAIDQFCHSSPTPKGCGIFQSLATSAFRNPIPSQNVTVRLGCIAKEPVAAELLGGEYPRQLPYSRQTLLLFACMRLNTATESISFDVDSCI